ncbi:hypothetical protein TNCV_3830571 [Trichonephila clavipes]|nr:hypothetical protein TNCV_3830571 [Trichonephila clavipes]
MGLCWDRISPVINIHLPYKLNDDVDYPGAVVIFGQESGRRTCRRCHIKTGRHIGIQTFSTLWGNNILYRRPFMSGCIGVDKDQFMLMLIVFF